MKDRRSRGGSRGGRRETLARWRMRWTVERLSSTGSARALEDLDDPPERATGFLALGLEDQVDELGLEYAGLAAIFASLGREAGQAVLVVAVVPGLECPVRPRS